MDDLYFDGPDPDFDPDRWDEEYERAQARTYEEAMGLAPRPGVRRGLVGGERLA